MTAIAEAREKPSFEADVPDDAPMLPGLAEDAA